MAFSERERIPVESERNSLGSMIGERTDPIQQETALKKQATDVAEHRFMRACVSHPSAADRFWFTERARIVAIKESKAISDLEIKILEPDYTPRAYVKIVEQQNAIIRYLKSREGK